MMDNVRTTNLSTATYYYVVAFDVAINSLVRDMRTVLLFLCTSKVMYITERDAVRKNIICSPAGSTSVVCARQYLRRSPTGTGI